jgi:pantoate--beta-alanine ligase
VEVFRDPQAWQRWCFAARDSGRRLALTPTMGYLHEGHVALLREARRAADAGGGPGTQFGPNEDLARYPRDLAGDLARCEAAGVDGVLAPERPDQVYASRHETWIEVERVSRGLCGARRPGHFRGVATVVGKLFNLTRPHAALFGEKDWQQLQVVRAMVRDLDFGIEVVGVPTVREHDGLARSSRNAYLSQDERPRAVALSRALSQAQARVAGGERDPVRLVAEATRSLEAAGARIDYVEVVEPASLEPVVRVAPGTRMLIAAFFGATRLIDNVALP